MVNRKNNPNSAIEIFAVWFWGYWMYPGQEMGRRDDYREGEWTPAGRFSLGMDNCANFGRAYPDASV